MTLYLIDGNSYIYRAFYAIKGLTDPQGRPTNAAFGFTNMLMKIVREKRPDALVVSFDRPERTERHEMYAAYKVHRKETPDELVEQIPLIKELIRAFRIPVFEVAGYEADDVLATLAQWGAGRGMEVFIVTSDKDMLQLVGGPIKVYDPMKDRVLGEEYVTERYGVPPARIVEYMALVGDASDNIPGLKGVGDKTAKDLLGRFGSLGELMENPGRIEKERLRKTVTEGRETIELSRRLAEIRCDVPLEIREGDIALKEPDWQALLRIFRERGFTSLMQRIPESSAGRAFEAVLTEERLREILEGVRDEFALRTLAPEGEGLLGLSLSTPAGESVYVPLAHRYEGTPRQMDLALVLGLLAPLFEDERVSKAGHDMKKDILALRAEGGRELRGTLLDVMVASYLLNPLRAGHTLETLALEYLSKRKKTLNGSAGLAALEVREAAQYMAEEAELARELEDVLFARISREGLDRAYYEMEMPLLTVLADMEEAGMRMDAGRLAELSKELVRELQSLKQRIYFLAGEEFNINSPRQLGRVLFERLGMKPGKRKKTGYSTEMSVLEELAREHELPREVLNWRTLAKLKNTYVDVLPRLVRKETGRLHTSFNQTVTATGRLSSTEPNLQNIPIRGAWGARIRECFAAEEGNILLSADYSQIELRLLAHLSGDAALGAAFHENRDIHARTASELFGVTPGEVTPEMRRVAKSVNFGVVYGISPFGLSESLGISREEAQRYITAYFASHPGVSAYISSVLEQAARDGYVATLMGRRRPIPELRSRNRSTRLLGERLAVNTPMQGSAADIIKLAMVRINRRLKDGRLRARMILQVHDELLFEAPEAEEPEVSRLVRKEMEGVVELSVPLKVEMGRGRNWAEAAH
ncbi:MAG: DNA polymerase I [Nitrospirota bacterium]